MTTKQSQQLVQNPNTKKAITALRKYAIAEEKLKALAKDAEEATALLKQAMIDANVPKMVFDPELSGIEGYITLAERTNYKAEDISEVPAEYTKPTLDTDKVKAQHTLTGQLPVGVVESKTPYITKKLKVVK